MLILFLISAISIIVSIPFFLNLLRKVGIGQVVRDEGPEFHIKKSGTPTMGGILFILITLIIFIVFSLIKGFNVKSYLIIYMFLSFSFIGFLDDFIKTIKKSPYGLKARVNIFLQIILSIPFLLIVFKTKSFNFNPIIFFIFDLIVILATTNSVNLTDGLDGLLSGISIPILIFYFIISKDLSISAFSITLAGALLGFLFFNFYPAKIFMGNVGSFAIGGVISSLAILTNTELVLLILGGIFVIEALSDIIQVSYFKYTKKKTGVGKRVFLMAPIHHHFELKGYKEPFIVVRFWIIQAILTTVSIIII